MIDYTVSRGYDCKRTNRRQNNYITYRRNTHTIDEMVDICRTNNWGAFSYFVNGNTYYIKPFTTMVCVSTKKYLKPTARLVILV